MVLYGFLRQQHVPPVSDNERLWWKFWTAHTITDNWSSNIALKLTYFPICALNGLCMLRSNVLKLKINFLLAICDFTINITILFIQHGCELVAVISAWILHELQHPGLVYHRLCRLCLMWNSDQVSNLSHKHYPEIFIPVLLSRIKSQQMWEIIVSFLQVIQLRINSSFYCTLF